MQMPKWEYKTVTYIDEANKLGKNGWEAVGVTKGDLILLKRKYGYRVIEERDVATGKIINNVTTENSFEIER